MNGRIGVIIATFSCVLTTFCLGWTSFPNMVSSPAHGLVSSTRRSEKKELTSMYASTNRRDFLLVETSRVLLLGGGLLFVPKSANALVKGNAPPPPKQKDGNKPKCRTIDECQEMAEKAAKEEEELEKANAEPALIAPKGTRYRDMTLGDTTSSSSVQTGSDIEIYYKVLKSGKRSYDGLSGEGTVVFSRGFGLEDDETKAGDKTFRFTVGDPSVIGALNDATIGMTVGGTRRIAVLPQSGWELPDKACDGGPGGSGAGGEIKTDYVVVPTATMVATETCFDKSKRPFPTSYAEQRRMAQRFDQALIMEVQLVQIHS